MRITHLQKSPNYANKSLNNFTVGDSWIPVWLVSGAVDWCVSCESVGKADLLSDNFDSKQSREAVNLSLTCHPFPSLTIFAGRSREVRHLLLHMDAYGTNPLGMFLLFLKRTADVTASRLPVVFQWLVMSKHIQRFWTQIMNSAVFAEIFICQKWVFLPFWLDHVVSGARFLTGCVFQCGIAYQSMAILCMLYKIRCKLQSWVWWCRGGEGGGG